MWSGAGLLVRTQSPGTWGDTAQDPPPTADKAARLPFMSCASVSSVRVLYKFTFKQKGKQNQCAKFRDGEMQGAGSTAGAGL